MCQPKVCLHWRLPYNIPQFCHRQYMCICASHVLVGLLLIVLHLAQHVAVVSRVFNTHNSRPSQSYGPRGTWENYYNQTSAFQAPLYKSLLMRAPCLRFGRLKQFPVQKIQFDHPSVSLGDQFVCEVLHNNSSSSSGRDTIHS